MGGNHPWWLDGRNRTRAEQRMAAGVTARAPRGTYDKKAADRARVAAKRAAAKTAEKAAFRRQHVVGRVRLHGKGPPPQSGPLPPTKSPASVATSPHPCTPPAGLVAQRPDPVTPDPVTPELFAAMDQRMREYDVLEKVERRAHFLNGDRNLFKPKPGPPSATRALLFGKAPVWLR